VGAALSNEALSELSKIVALGTLAYLLSGSALAEEKDSNTPI
jgi:hypothetical protein